MTDAREASVVRGVALPAAATLGEAPTSHVGPTPSNGFDTRWADDLDLLASAGVRAIRVPLDWPRLQPRAGPLDGSWCEWYTALLHHARGLGVAVWATLHERGVPRWFDDEGGFDDVVAAGRAWPRWAERVAERFGDLVEGWVPLVPTVANRRIVWRDTWGILRGGPAVMKAATMPADADAVERDAEDRTARDCDVAGVVLALAHADLADDDARRRTTDRIGDWIRLVHETGPGVPAAVAALTVVTADRAEHAAGIEVARAAIEDASGDGVPLHVAFAEPGVDGGDTLGLYDRDRSPTASAAAWLD